MGLHVRHACDFGSQALPLILMYMYMYVEKIGESEDEANLPMPCVESIYITYVVRDVCILYTLKVCDLFW